MTIFFAHAKQIKNKSNLCPTLFYARRQKKTRILVRKKKLINESRTCVLFTLVDLVSLEWVFSFLGLIIILFLNYFRVCERGSRKKQVAFVEGIVCDMVDSNSISLCPFFSCKKIKAKPIFIYILKNKARKSECIVSLIVK